MKKLFKINPNIPDEIVLSENGTELDEIWSYLNQVGIPSFQKDEVEKYWREYSDDVWDSEFIAVDFETLENFVNYLA